MVRELRIKRTLTNRIVSIFFHPWYFISDTKYENIKSYTKELVFHIFSFLRNRFIAYILCDILLHYYLLGNESCKIRMY